MPTMTEEIATGTVEHVSFYESTVGARDRTVAFLQINGQPQMFVFDADVRDHLPIGRNVQIRYAPAADKGTVTLLERELL